MQAATGPLLAAAIIFPFGQGSLAWFSLAALLAMFILWKVGNWYRQQHRSKKMNIAPKASGLSVPVLWSRWGVLLLLITSKYLYLASLTNYYTFYLMHHFGLDAQAAQYHLFIFLFAVAAGTVLGGPIGDKIGRKRVIWFSILGVAPFTLALPHADLLWTSILSFVIGFILASAFSAILVYARIGAWPGWYDLGLFFVSLSALPALCGPDGAISRSLWDRICLSIVWLVTFDGVITALLPTLHKR